MRLALVSGLALLLGCSGSAPPPRTAAASAEPANTPTSVAPDAQVAAPVAPRAALLQNPNQEFNDRVATAIADRIAGRENEPAEQVFRNIQSLKGTAAGRLVRIMNMGYSRALGVSCYHCHVSHDYSSDDKRQKRAAREMIAMNKTINDRLRSLQNLEGKPEEKFVNCTTCHRGQVDPNAGLQ